MSEVNIENFLDETHKLITCIRDGEDNKANEIFCNLNDDEKNIVFRMLVAERATIKAKSDEYESQIEKTYEELSVLIVEIREALTEALKDQNFIKILGLARRSIEATTQIPETLMKQVSVINTEIVGLVGVIGKIASSGVSFGASLLAEDGSEN